MSCGGARRAVAVKGRHQHYACTRAWKVSTRTTWVGGVNNGGPATQVWCVVPFNEPGAKRCHRHRPGRREVCRCVVPICPRVLCANNTSPLESSVAARAYISLNHKCLPANPVWYIPQRCQNPVTLRRHQMAARVASKTETNATAAILPLRAQSCGPRSGGRHVAETAHTCSQRRAPTRRRSVVRRRHGYCACCDIARHAEVAVA